MTWMYIILGCIVLAVVLFVLFYQHSKKKGRIYKLDRSLDEKIDQVQGRLKVGDIGNSIGRLAPAGKALFEDEEYEVSSQGEYIDENTEIVIKRIVKNKIIVSKK